MAGKHTEVGAKCQGNASVTHGSECKVTREWRGMQRNNRGTNGSGYKVPGVCRGMQGNARGMKGSGEKCQGNAGE